MYFRVKNVYRIQWIKDLQRHTLLILAELMEENLALKTMELAIRTALLDKVD